MNRRPHPFAALRPMLIASAIFWLCIGIAIVAIVGCEHVADAAWRADKAAFERQFTEEP